MRRFLIKILIFGIPILALITVPPFLTLYTSGENFHQIEGLMIRSPKYLTGYLYNENNYHYLKWRTLASESRFSIWVVGSSRVLQFRREMFDSTFYNAGFTISGINDFIPFLEGLPDEKHPSFLIVGLDQWMFNENWDALSFAPPPTQWSLSFSQLPNKAIAKNVWSDLKKKNVRLLYSNEENGIEKIGLNAHENNTGFRRDGSILYGSQINKLLNDDSTAADFAYANTYARIEEGVNRFEYGDSVNPKALAELDRFLQFCNVHHIHVIAFIPPFADKVNERLQISGRYPYLSEIYPQCVPSFEKYGFELYDFSHLSTYSSDDSEMIDGFHGGEVSCLKMLINILEDHSRLGEMTNLLRLKKDLFQKKNRYLVYDLY